MSCPGTSSVTKLPGATVNVSADISNTSSTAVTGQLKIVDAANNPVASSTSASIGGGATQTFTASFTAPASAGTYTYTAQAYNVDNATVDDQCNFTVNVSTAGALSIVSVTLA